MTDPTATSPPVTALRRLGLLELLFDNDPVFRSALVGLSKYVVDTLRVRHARDEAVRQMANWAQQDWARRIEGLKGRPPTG